MLSRSAAFWLGAASLAVASAACGAPGPRLTPRPGDRAYRYEVAEIQGDRTTGGYRMDFRLRAEPRGGVVAIVLAAEGFEGGTWRRAELDRACRQALHAGPGELARVRLHPLTPEAAALGSAFMADCAPRELFFPMTDILNATLVQTSDRFHIHDLTPTTPRAQFSGFDTHLHRLGLEMTESSTAGEIALSAVDGRTVVDWAPATAQLELIREDPKTGGRIALSGTERYALRLTIDPATGVLDRAETTFDDLDLVVAIPNLPPEKRPRVQLRRVMTITRVR